MKTEKERELRQLNLDMRQSDLNVRKLTADTENQSINSTINGVVKAVGRYRKFRGNEWRTFYSGGKRSRDLCAGNIK